MSAEERIAKQVIGRVTGDPKEEARRKIEELLANPPSDYLVGTFALLFSKLVGRSESNVLLQVRVLAGRQERDMSGRNKCERATRHAVECIWRWYNGATEYRSILADSDAVLSMLESHDSVCVWAVMLGQIDASKGE